jgi:hypothetical protein
MSRRSQINRHYTQVTFALSAGWNRFRSYGAERVAGIRKCEGQGQEDPAARVVVDPSIIAALRAQGHSWSTIRREMDLGKRTAQRAFCSLERDKSGEYVAVPTWVDNPNYLSNGCCVELEKINP